MGGRVGPHLSSTIMHAIVEWLDEDPPQVSVVPQTWITNFDDTTYCYFPPQNIAKRLKRKNFETHKLPVPDENWSTPEFVV